MKPNEMNAQERALVNNIMAMSNTVAEKKRIAKALGLEWNQPSVKEQLDNKGMVVGDFKRGRALNGRKMVVLPPVTLGSDRVVPQLAVEPSCARAVAFELLRIADSNGW